MKTIKNFFENKDQYAKHSGIELLELSQGYSKTRMEIKKHHLNGVGMVHGGAIFTLADFAFAAASNSYGTIAVALQVNISFIQAASTGDVLTAEAKEVSRHPKIGLYSIKITNKNNELIADFQGTAYRKHDALPMTQ